MFVFGDSLVMEISSDYGFGSSDLIRSIGSSDFFRWVFSYIWRMDRLGSKKVDKGDLNSCVGSLWDFGGLD